MPNIVNGHDLDDDARPRIIAAVVTTAALALISYIMRVFARKITKSKFLLSDYFATLAMGSAIVQTVLVCQCTTLGLGRHQELMQLDNIRPLLLLNYAQELNYSIGVTMIKLSILFLYKRLFPTRWVLIWTNILIVYTVMWGLDSLFVNAFQCKPIYGAWEFFSEHTCIDTKLFFAWNGGLSLLSDLFILAIPLPEIWSLQLSRQLKALLTGIFTLGLFATITCALRIYFQQTIDDSDQTWTYIGIAIWTCTELNVGVLCCCLPTIRPFLRTIIPDGVARKASRKPPVSASEVSSGWSSFWPLSFSRGSAKSSATAVTKRSYGSGKGISDHDGSGIDEAGFHRLDDVTPEDSIRLRTDIVVEREGPFGDV